MWGPFFDFNQESHPSTALWLRGCSLRRCWRHCDTGQRLVVLESMKIKTAVNAEFKAVIEI
ncbi:hypothetical protein OAP17_10225 [Porticoccaceae bacterium]|nr:hypothetical protein [Porticoccaceae bacterium]